MIDIDEESLNQDWTKQTWDLPPYKSDEFLVIFPNLQAFRQLPIYKMAIQRGLIKNDKWTRKEET